MVALGPARSGIVFRPPPTPPHTQLAVVGPWPGDVASPSLNFLIFKVGGEVEANERAMSSATSMVWVNRNCAAALLLCMQFHWSLANFFTS